VNTDYEPSHSENFSSLMLPAVRSRYSPQLPDIRHPQSMLVPYCEGQVSHIYKTSEFRVTLLKGHTIIVKDVVTDDPRSGPGCHVEIIQEK
jgi:hypothetical protein